MKPIVLALFLALAACATKVDAGNEAGGIINGTGASDATILGLADAHCHHYGKVARVSGALPPRTIYFDCVN